MDWLKLTNKYNTISFYYCGIKLIKYAENKTEKIVRVGKK